jgi:hypothetical protein
MLTNKPFSCGNFPHCFYNKAAIPYYVTDYLNK